MKRTLIAVLIVLVLSAAHLLWADEESYVELDIFDLIRHRARTNTFE